MNWRQMDDEHSGGEKWLQITPVHWTKDGQLADRRREDYANIRMCLSPYVQEAKKKQKNTRRGNMV